MTKYRTEIVVKTKECDKIQYAELDGLDVIDELFEKLQEAYESYGAKIKSIRFIKEEE